MTKSEQIRMLAREGLNVSEIASKLGIRYQHAYNVIRAGSTLRPGGVATASASKPPLTSAQLTAAGFKRVACWCMREGRLGPDCSLPKEPGVYAFVKDGRALYVGLETMGVAKRCYFYSRPGPTQKTSQRLNKLLAAEISQAAEIDLYAAFPPDLEWNGLPVHGSAGLELGLIKNFALPWNVRSAS